MKKLIHHELKWFIGRIGNIVYRSPIHNPICCTTCKTASEYGIFIKDKLHAGYLFTVQGDLGVEYGDKQIK